MSLSLSLSLIRYSLLSIIDVNKGIFLRRAVSVFFAKSTMPWLTTYACVFVIAPLSWMRVLLSDYVRTRTWPYHRVGAPLVES